MQLPYIAASSYLNAAPLAYSFIKGSQKDRCRILSDAAPWRCAEMLQQGVADAALIPVIEYQRIGGLAVEPGACVSSRKSVQSVILASRVPIENIGRVAIDTSSRTSVTLIRIILDRFYELSPSYSWYPPRIEEMLESEDAALIIGDPAMLIDRSSLFVYDLAEEWRKFTGLPFVFAFWAIRQESPLWNGSKSSLGQINFAEAKAEGLAHINEIAGDYSALLNLPKAELVSYLTDSINYTMDEECIEGLRKFFELACDNHLIEGIKELIFSR